MLKEGQVERRSAALHTRLIDSSRFKELLVVLAVEWVLLEVAVDFSHQLVPLLAILPGFGKLFRCSRCFVLPSRSNDSFVRACHGCQEIGRSLLLWANESQVFEVDLGISSFTKENLVAFVQYNNFVEQL